MLTKLNLNGPKTLTLQADHISFILDGLSSVPYKISAPIIEDIMLQLKAQDPSQPKTVEEAANAVNIAANKSGS